MARIRGRFVLTGGPCAGKTSALVYLLRQMLDKGLYPIFVPEAATILLKMGITPAVVGAFSFQRRVLELILKLEEIALAAANEADRDVVIFYDRGIPDGRAYMSPAEYEELLRIYELTVVEARDQRYTSVFHLRSAAFDKEEFYTLANNEVRKETPAEARELDQRTLRAWSGVPHLTVIDNSTDFAGKLLRLLQAVCFALGMPVPLEIERKFLVMPINFDRQVEIYQPVAIEQAYLINPTPDEELRVRKRGQDNSFLYYQTRKREAGTIGSRVETEAIIDERQYLWSLGFRMPGTDILRKKRTCFVANEQYFEHDLFPGTAKALLEIELTNVNDKLAIPDYVEVICDVTDDPAYRNASLARNGLAVLE